MLGDQAAIASGVYLALSPLVLTVWTVKLRGGYVSVMAIGHAVLWLACRIGQDGVTRRRALWLGLLAGVGAWLNLLVLPFLFAAGLYLLSRRALFSKRMLASTALGFAVGFAPFWLDNVLSGGATFATLFGDQEHDVAENLANTLGRIVPYLSGALAPWDEPSPWTWLHPVLIVMLVAVAWIVMREWRSLLGFVSFSRRATSGAELYLLTGLGYVLCAALTRFGSDDHPRYALVLYTLIAPAIGALVASVWARGAVLRVVAGVGLVALCGYHLTLTLIHDPAQVVASLGMARRRASPPLRYREFYALLEEKNVDGIAADPWVGMLASFDTGERIGVSPSRFPAQLERFAQARRRAWVVLPSGCRRPRSHVPARSGRRRSSRDAARARGTVGRDPRRNRVSERGVAYERLARGLVAGHWRSRLSQLLAHSAGGA